MRPTSPQMYLSSITSPTTSRRFVPHRVSISPIASCSCSITYVLHIHPLACCYHSRVSSSASPVQSPAPTTLRTIFLDRDGVINVKPPEGEYVTKWSKFQLLPGVPEAIARLNRADLKVVVVSNQRGIAL